MFLDDKLKIWREAFLGLLVHLYETVYCVDGLVEPDAVRMASYEYKEEFDNFAKFRNSRIRISPGEQTDFQDFTRAYRHWAEWVGGGSGKRLDNKTLRKRMEDEFGTADEGKYFRNIIVFMSDEDVEAWDKDHPVQA
jgi:phage/plasmid-associated DNA primase